MPAAQGVNDDLSVSSSCRSQILSAIGEFFVGAIIVADGLFIGLYDGVQREGEGVAFGGAGRYYLASVVSGCWLTSRKSCFITVSRLPLGKWLRRLRSSTWTAAAIWARDGFIPRLFRPCTPGRIHRAVGHMPALGICRMGSHARSRSVRPRHAGKLHGRVLAMMTS